MDTRSGLLATGSLTLVLKRNCFQCRICHLLTKFLSYWFFSLFSQSSFCFPNISTQDFKCLISLRYCNIICHILMQDVFFFCLLLKSFGYIKNDNAVCEVILFYFYYSHITEMWWLGTIYQNKCWFIKLDSPLWSKRANSFWLVHFLVKMTHYREEWLSLSLSEGFFHWLIH